MVCVFQVFLVSLCQPQRSQRCSLFSFTTFIITPNIESTSSPLCYHLCMEIPLSSPSVSVVSLFLFQCHNNFITMALQHGLICNRENPSSLRYLFVGLLYFLFQISQLHLWARNRKGDTQPHAFQLRERNFTATCSPLNLST